MIHMRGKDMAKFTALLFVCFFFGADGAAQSGCTYVATNGDAIGVYECDYNAVTLPLAYSAFSSPIPQRMKIYNVHGQLPASNPTATFSGFSGFGTLDPDYPASLEIRCQSKGQLLLFAGTFTGMGYLQELTISNCAIVSGLVSSGFSPIGTLNYFEIYGGSLTTVAYDALTGLDIQKITTIPNPRGELVLNGVTLPDTTLPLGLLYSQANLVSVRLDNLGLTLLRSDDLSQNTKLEKISLKYNAFTDLSEGFLNGLTKVNSLDLTGISWNCTCDTVWLAIKANDTGLILESGITCATPALYESKFPFLLFHQAIYCACATLPYTNVSE